MVVKAAKGRTPIHLLGRHLMLLGKTQSEIPVLVELPVAVLGVQVIFSMALRVLLFPAKLVLFHEPVAVVAVAGVTEV